jgi:hypothetical protein
MTVAIDSAVAGSGLTELVARTESLLAHRRSAAQWWVDLVACLDDLGARAMTLRQDPGGRTALAEQIRMDAPHLYGHLRRLEDESETLQQDILRVRISAGESAGDEGRLAELASDIRAVLRRMRRLELRSNSVVIDAYDRDIGGEWLRRESVDADGRPGRKVQQELLSAGRASRHDVFGHRAAGGRVVAEAINDLHLMSAVLTILFSVHAQGHNGIMPQ